MEIWKDIEGFEGLYQVSNLGKVKSLSRVLKSGHKWKEKIVAITYNKYDKYGRVMLSNGGKTRRFLIHRLVAQAFIPNPDNLPLINHKDENPSNNCANNLEWCTQKYNNSYGTHNERMIRTQLNRNDVSKRIICVEINKEFPSISEAGRWLGK